jgi:hypothetical protein
MALPFLEVIAREALYEVFLGGSLINTVTRDFESTVSSQGESVTVVMPETPTMKDAGGVFASAAATPSTVTLKLDKYRETLPIKVDLKSMSLADRNVLAMYATPIAEAIRLDLEAAILAEVVAFTDLIGNAAGTVVPTGIDGVAVAPKAKFDAIKAPFDNRFVVAGTSLEAEYWKAFGLASQAGDVAVAEQIKGFMGTKLGQTYISNADVESGARLGVAYHKNSVALATRPMRVSDLAPNTMTTVSYNGIGLTVEAWHSPENSCDYIRGQVLYGLKALTGKGFKINKLTQ